MSKIITSPVKRYPGTVTLSDPMTLPQVIAVEDAIHAAQGLRETSASQAQYDLTLLPGLCACVETWNLDGLGNLTAETFPATPRIAAQQLLAWLINEVMRLYGDDDPNG